MSMSETATKTLDDPSSKLDRAAAVAIRNIRATIHTTSIDIPLLDGKVAGYGREEQKEFVFCEVETDQGVSGFGLTGHFLARSVVAALERHILPLVTDMDPPDVDDRKSVLKGTSVAILLDLAGRRLVKKTKKQHD